LFCCTVSSSEPTWATAGVILVAKCSTFSGFDACSNLAYPLFRECVCVLASKGYIAAIGASYSIPYIVFAHTRKGPRKAWRNIGGGVCQWFIQMQLYTYTVIKPLQHLTIYSSSLKKSPRQSFKCKRGAVGPVCCVLEPHEWKWISKHTHTGSRPSQMGCSCIPVLRFVLIRWLQSCAAVWTLGLWIQTWKVRTPPYLFKAKIGVTMVRLQQSTAWHHWLRNDNKHSRSVVPANLLMFSQSRGLADNTGRLTQSVFRLFTRFIFHITCCCCLHCPSAQNLTRPGRARLCPDSVWTASLALNCYDWLWYFSSPFRA